MFTGKGMIIFDHLYFAIMKEQHLKYSTRLMFLKLH